LVCFKIVSSVKTTVFTTFSSNRVLEVLGKIQLPQLVLVTNESQSSATNLLLTQHPTCSW